MLRTLLLLALTSAAAAVAHADPDPQALTDARAHFQQGKAYLDAKVYDKAIAEFEAAYKLSPFPELVFNVAQAYRLADQPDKAITAYQEYLASSPSGELADESRVHVAELTKLVDDRKRTADAAALQQHQQATADAAAHQAQATADHDRAQRQYASARTHYDAVMHNRHVGEAVLIVSGLVGVGGIVLVIPDPASGQGAVGFVAIIAGVTGALIGGAITASSNPGAQPVPPPAVATLAAGPAVHAVGWTFRF
jgi:hypothetical protein|nr:tetratricopeptide repeat protein [Kofleriaceae bacterium]